MEDDQAALTSVESYAKKLEAEEAKARQRAVRRRWTSSARDCIGQVCVIYLILKHPRSSRLAKVVAGLSAGYVFSPIQLIPNFIPVVGWLDDAAVLYVGMRLLQRITPAAVMTECRANAAVVVAKLFRDKGTDGERLQPTDLRGST
jgi:uncharacterized membrane protein YkvA (DUF1232 family)